MNRQSILQFLHESYRTIKADICIKSRSPGQNLVSFHFMLPRIQQGSDIRIHRIFLQRITFHLHPVFIHIQVKARKIHRITEQIDIFISRSQINGHKLRNTGIVDKYPDKPFTGN